MRITILITLLAQLASPAPRPGHATVQPSPTELTGAPGAKLALFVDVTPKPGIHVYAPGSKDYIPITVKLNALPEIKTGKIAYPKSELMTFADEKVPVFQKPFRLTQDVTVDKSAKSGSTVAVSGTVNYQACDDRVCYAPESAPVTWTILVK